MRVPFTGPEREYIEYMRGQSIYGDPQTVKSRLESIAEEYGVDDLILVTITYDFAARKRSYALLAEAFGLDRQPGD